MERAGFMTCTAASHQGVIKEPTASILRTSETHPMSSNKAHHFRGEEHFQIWTKDYEGKKKKLWIDLHELIIHPKNSNVG